MRAALSQPAVQGLVFALGLMSNLASHAQPPEPDGYRMDDYRAPTPNTVTGGMMLDTDSAHTLWESGSAAWIDVLPGVGGAKQSGQFPLGVLASAADCCGGGSALAGGRVGPERVTKPE